MTTANADDSGSETRLPSSTDDAITIKGVAATKDSSIKSAAKGARLRCHDHRSETQANQAKNFPYFMAHC
ncbi:hypothetical protein Ae201684_003576 [Aphanomyces euteiches]|uniref:Uncharacterized protein n=1 Tax=Aphanomyces euteiches TaxID=100861 RepID=A0A6G0XKW9_9STRA|nr:hypothetical protein Ae201684_003576 [Aphanomyces euteiches]